MSGEQRRVEIPGLGRSISVPVNPVPERKPQPRTSKYGFPFGRYLVNGERWWFSYDAQLIGTKVRRYEDGKWSEMVGKRDVDAVVAEIRSDAYAAAIAWGRNTKTCSLCGRTLSAEESLRWGIGEDCARKEYPAEWSGEVT